LLEKYPKEVKLVHKFLPGHDFTWKAATAAMAADEQGKFWEYHDQLFENQKLLNEAKLIEIADKLKLNTEKFRKKMKDPAITGLIQRDFDDAKKLDITATPWVYINGRHIKDLSLQNLVDTVNKELKR
jgi:protein-disulfide isomerase